MPMKSVPLSVRLSPDDAEFIARLKLDDAATPSEKVRGLIAEARRRREGYSDYAECLSMAHQTFAPVQKQLRTAENRQHVHSELVQALSEWIPETIAFVLTALVSLDEEEELRRLSEFEAGLADRAFWLIENVLRLGVTQECRGYDPRVVSQRVDVVRELVGVINSTRSRGALPSSATAKSAD